jgi:hypothetical protein
MFRPFKKYSSRDTVSFSMLSELQPLQNIFQAMGDTDMLFLGGDVEGSYSRLRRKKSGSARTRSHTKTKLKSSSSLQMQAQPSEHTTCHETRTGSCEQVLDTRKPGISNYCANQMQCLPLTAGSCIQKIDTDSFLLKPRDKMMQNSEDDRPKLVCNAEIQTEGSRWKCGSGDVNHGEAALCRLENSFSLPLLPIDAATQVGLFDKQG